MLSPSVSVLVFDTNNSCGICFKSPHDPQGGAIHEVH
jgi:hypothetical protein